MISAKVKGFDNKYSRTLCGTSTEDEYEVPDDIGSPDMFVADQDEVNHFRAKLQNALAKDSVTVPHVVVGCVKWS